MIQWMSSSRKKTDKKYWHKK